MLNCVSRGRWRDKARRSGFSSHSHTFAFAASGFYQRLLPAVFGGWGTASDTHSHTPRMGFQWVTGTQQSAASHSLPVPSRCTHLLWPREHPHTMGYRGEVQPSLNPTLGPFLHTLTQPKGILYGSPYFPLDNLWYRSLPDSFTSGDQAGATFRPRDTGGCLHMFSVSHLGKEEGLFLATSVQRPGMLLNILGARTFPQIHNYPAPNVNGRYSWETPHKAFLAETTVSFVSPPWTLTHAEVDGEVQAGRWN